LLESTPSVVGEKKKLRSLDGEPPSLIDEVKGCSFSPRCPEPTEACKNGTKEMGLIEVAPGHFADQCCVECR
jgi:oligopeptide/dipeptide ABC transporter ATP-binding protein